MIIPFTELPESGGGWPRPILDVAVAGMDDVLVPCLVDSGSLHTLLPRWTAEATGIAVDGAPSLQLAVGATTTNATFVVVGLEAADHTWEAEVGFCHPWPYAWGLLGQLSFFRFFTVQFRAADFELELAPVAV